MNRLKQIGLLIGFLIVHGIASAEGFFEPGINYFLASTVTNNNQSTGDSTTELDAIDMSLNGGYIINNKYEIAGFVDVILDGSGSNSDADQSYGLHDSSLGLQFAYLINEKMKAWFGYVFQRSLTLDEDSERGLTIKGDGILFGFGHKVSKMYINAEYRIYSYSRGEYAGSDLDNPDYTEETIVVGVSYPF